MNVSFLVAPTFSHISYPDDAPVQDAFTQVLAVRKKDDPDGALLQQLEKDGFSTVGSLRAMTDSEWKKVNLPAIARIYLKYLVRQSVRPPLSTNSAGPATSSSDAQFMQVLANEFNFGKPFDPNEYNANLDMLAGMGFSKPESMEAIILTDNRGAEAALEFLIAVKPGQRRQQRLEAALRAGRCAKGYDPRTSPAAPIAAPANTSSEGQVVEKIVEKVIVDDRAVKSAQEKYRKESAKSAQLESENAKLKKEMKKFLDQMGAQVYKEYLRGMIAAKKLSKKQYDALLKYQQKNKISSAQHFKILEELGHSKSDFEEMKEFVLKRDEECVVCLENKKTHVISPCMHMCLCADCATGFEGKNAKCPMCSKKVGNIARIYM